MISSVAATQFTEIDMQLNKAKIYLCYCGISPTTTGGTREAKMQEKKSYWTEFFLRIFPPLTENKKDALARGRAISGGKTKLKSTGFRHLP